MNINTLNTEQLVCFFTPSLLSNCGDIFPRCFNRLSFKSSYSINIIVIKGTA